MRVENNSEPFLLCVSRLILVSTNFISLRSAVCDQYNNNNNNYYYNHFWSSNLRFCCRTVMSFKCRVLKLVSVLPHGASPVCNAVGNWYCATQLVYETWSVAMYYYRIPYGYKVRRSRNWIFNTNMKYSYRMRELKNFKIRQVNFCENNSS